MGHCPAENHSARCISFLASESAATSEGEKPPADVSCSDPLHGPTPQDPLSVGVSVKHTVERISTAQHCHCFSYPKIVQISRWTCRPVLHQRWPAKGVGSWPLSLTARCCKCYSLAWFSQGKPTGKHCLYILLSLNQTFHTIPGHRLRPPS